jgi:polyisoprenoid-binding protein YceI
MKLFSKTFNISLTKTQMPVFYLSVMIVALLSACRGPEAKEASVADSLNTATTGKFLRYGIDIKESLITWRGSMVFASKGQHAGYARFSKGEIMLEKDQLVGGLFEVDMNSITDPVHGSDNDLIEHLKSADFFDVQKFPAANFAVAMVSAADSGNVNITGNLTMKGITQVVTFPAKLEVQDSVIYANGRLIIDRTKWDVRYKSGKFFQDLADEAISDDIIFDVRIVAKNGC